MPIFTHYGISSIKLQNVENKNIQWNPHDFISECSMTTAIHSRTQSESSYQYNCRKNTKLYKNFKYQQH